jgi:hypothetical protein
MTAKNDEACQLALIAIQGQLQRPMSVDDVARELNRYLPDIDGKMLVSLGRKYCEELWKLGIFVVARTKLPDSVSGKRVVHYALPKFCSDGVDFGQAAEAELTEKLELLAAFMATTMADTIWDKAGHMGLVNANGVDVSQEDLGIDPGTLKKINLKTLLRLRQEYLKVVVTVAENTTVPDNNNADTHNMP